MHGHGLVATQLVIAAAATLAPRLKIPAPLILVFAGICVSLVPGVPEMAIAPDIILIGLLPPLLYASATSVPVMNFRRELIAINGLSVVLVVLSSLALGAALVWLVPGLGFGWGVALGAILSPTDGVAAGIIKGHGVPGRVVEIGLEGVIFLTMGLQLSTILRKLSTGPVGLERALLIAVLVLVVTIAVRGLYVALLLWRLQGRAEREQARQPRIVQMQHELEACRIPEEMAHQVRRWRMDLGEGLDDHVVKPISAERLQQLGESGRVGRDD